MQMPAANATPALQLQLERDLFGKPISTVADHALVPIEEVMDAVEADDADEDQIDGNDVIEEARHDEDQDAGNNRDERRDMGRGDDHGLTLWLNYEVGTNATPTPEKPGSYTTRERGARF
jgi:hypothetical protein